MDNEMLKQAMEIIADGCGCHRECEQLAGSPDAYCGCEKDAEKIIALVRAAASAEPVAWLITWSDVGEEWTKDPAKAVRAHQCNAKVAPLYTHPAPDAYTQAEMDEADREADEIHSALFAAPDAEIVAALADARDAFEAIRLVLIDHLNEPERSAFWKAVRARDAAAAALAKAKGARS